MSPQNITHYITRLQNALICVSVAFLIAWPPLWAFYGDLLPVGTAKNLYFLSIVSVTIVMVLRPLANIFPQYRSLCCAVLLRKGFGILSASIIVGFILADIIGTGSGYFSYMFSPAYWSWETKRLLAHTGDICAVILLITSNNYAKRFLCGINWKRVQKLAYPYFYAGALYEHFSFGSIFATTAIIVVTFLTLWAFVINWRKKHPSEPFLPVNS